MSASSDETDPFLLNFAGWGNSQRIEDLQVSDAPVHHLDQNTRHYLGTWKATAICGNDITSSCLYVSGLAIAGAGMLAPVALILVSLTLYLFRKIYAEVGSALPLNGGTYTLLLNTTTKKKAAMAATLTILSYIATAVISANEAIHYIHTVFGHLPVAPATIALLAVFAALSIWGVSESANVALGIFIIHLVTLTLLIGAVFVFLYSDGPAQLSFNFSTFKMEGHWTSHLFKGFLLGLLGISGFESSANYIEEQGPGVFPKTLRNMWVAVTVFNPLLCLLALTIFRVDFITQNQNGLLAKMAETTAGGWLASIVAVDAFLVLSGAVLTSFVGIIGLVRRMTLDRCLPQILLRENRSRKTNHWIILGFFAVCVSVFQITEGKIESLAAVYTISFLAVMMLFAVGNILLKVRRSRLPRADRAAWPTVLAAFSLVALGLVGNIWLNPEGTRIFAAYYAIAVVFILAILLRTSILRFILLAVHASAQAVPGTRHRLEKLVDGILQPIVTVPIVFLTKGDSIATLNRAALYVLGNEQTKHLKIVHFYDDFKAVPRSLWYQARVIDQLYPHLRVDLILVKGKFGPPCIEALAARLDVAKNRMFIGTPGDRFPHRVEALGGVRVIL